MVKNIDKVFFGLILLFVVVGPAMLVYSHNQEVSYTLYAHRVEDGGWSMKVIRAKVGQDLVLKVSSQDVLHSFDCGALGINVELYPGQVHVVHIPTNQAGNFTFQCDIWCSPLHPAMRGYILIE